MPAPCPTASDLGGRRSALPPDRGPAETSRWPAPARRLLVRLPVMVTLGRGEPWWPAGSGAQVVALVSKNLDDSATWPVTVAPAWRRAVLMPVTTAPCRAGRGDDHDLLARPAGRASSARLRPPDANTWSPGPGSAGLLSRLLPADLRCFASWLGPAASAGPVQRGGADHDADGQREEDRDDGNQVVAKVDHEKSPVSQ